MEIQDKRPLEQEEKVRRREGEEGEDVRTGKFQRREGETALKAPFEVRRIHKCKNNQFNWLATNQ